MIQRFHFKYNLNHVKYFLIIKLNLIIKLEIDFYSFLKSEVFLTTKWFYLYIYFNIMKKD
ncbi:MAG TPA: hypothetical protein DCS19_07845 [Flavobacterium sp.]|nr:hypothetical protein [Flavobacterium sp.]